MTVVAFRLAGPLQAWGSGSRFVRRATEMSPTKSGVIGLVASAMGLRRTDPLDEFGDLRFGVRIDQPGQLMRDFHTAQRPERKRDGSVEWKSLPLSQRYYISDAVFLALLEGDRAQVEAIDQAVRAPEFPLYLGRRSCPPAGPVALGVFEHDLDTAFKKIQWLASTRHRKRRRDRIVTLATTRDARPDELEADPQRDVPVSFDPNHRQYAWRRVVRGSADVPNPDGATNPVPEHDPMN